MADGNTEDKISAVNVQGSFTVKNVPYTLCLTDINLSWKKTDGKGAETKIPVEDIVSVKTVTSKSSQTRTVDSWMVCYAQRKPKNVLRKTFVTFNGEESVCKQWTSNIQQLLDKLSQRPKKILVLINPVSGRSRGAKEYQNKVAPHFAEANIQTDVKITEKAQHSLGIIETYDLESIDSIVIVGGDGMFHEVCNGLLNRESKKSNIDLNDPNMEVPVVDIPIGIIPCGTGNGVAECTFGCKDVETAALAIIIGKRNNSNVETIHCAGKFVIFSVLLVGFGLWGQLIYKTEQNRQLGVLRYPLIMLQELLINTSRPIDYQVQYKKIPTLSDKAAGTTDEIAEASDKPADGKTGADKTIEKLDCASEIINGEEWVTVKKPYTGLISFSINVFGGGAEKVDDLFNSFTILATKSCTRMQMFKFFKRMMTKDVMRPLEFVDYMKTTEYKVKVVNQSDPSTEHGIVERLLDIDGEAVQIEQPEFTVSYFMVIHETVKLLTRGGGDDVLNCCSGSKAVIQAINPFPDDKILDCSNLKGVADDKTKHFPRKLWLFANVSEDYCLTFMSKDNSENRK